MNTCFGHFQSNYIFVMLKNICSLNKIETSLTNTNNFSLQNFTLNFLNNSKNSFCLLKESKIDILKFEDRSNINEICILRI